MAEKRLLCRLCKSDAQSRKKHVAALCPTHEIKKIIDNNETLSGLIHRDYDSICVCDHLYSDKAILWSPIEFEQISQITTKDADYHGTIQLQMDDLNEYNNIRNPLYFLVPRGQTTLKKNFQPTIGKGGNGRLTKNQSHYLPLLVGKDGVNLIVMRITAIAASREEMGSGVRIAQGFQHCFAFQTQGEKNIFNTRGAIKCDIGFCADLMIGSDLPEFKIMYHGYASKPLKSESVCFEEIILYPPLPSSENMVWSAPEVSPCSSNEGVRYSESPAGCDFSEKRPRKRTRSKLQEDHISDGGSVSSISSSGTINESPFEMVISHLDDDAPSTPPKRRRLNRDNLCTKIFDEASMDVLNSEKAGSEDDSPHDEPDDGLRKLSADETWRRADIIDDILNPNWLDGFDF